MTTAEPLTRYGAIEGRASRAAPLPSSYTTIRGTTPQDGHRPVILASVWQVLTDLNAADPAIRRLQ